MTPDLGTQDILDALVSLLLEVLPVAGAGVTLARPADPLVAVRAMAGRSVPPGDHREAASTGSRQAAETDGEGRSERAGHAPGGGSRSPERPIRDRDPLDEQCSCASARAGRPGSRAALTLLLAHDHIHLGHVHLFLDATSALEPPGLAVAQTIADVAAIYLLNARARAELRHGADRSQALARLDPLTGVGNRASMTEGLARALRRARRPGHTAAVLFVDLDRMKQVNDAYGHRTGDQLLIAVAQRLLGTVRPGDSVARIAGDEFVVVCEDLSDDADAAALRGRLRSALGRPFVLSDVVVAITASVGVAFNADGDVDPDDLLHQADLAMYRSKPLASRHLGPVDDPSPVRAVPDPADRSPRRPARQNDRLQAERSVLARCRAHLDALWLLACLAHRDRADTESAVVDALIAAARTPSLAAAGAPRIWSTLAGLVEREPPLDRSSRPAWDGPSAAQQEVIALVATGRQPHQVATLLGVSVPHVHRELRAGLVALGAGRLGPGDRTR